MSLRTVLGGVGAIVGGIIGGPFGAQLGWALGGIAGSIVDPQTVKGPTIGDIPSQTSAEGGPIPIIYGLSQPISGNVIADGGPVIVTNTERAGKGGPKYETETVHRTYAVGICEGPIQGILRVWRNQKLVYDVTDTPIVSDEDNALFLECARFFLGTYTQNASPDLEVIHGVGTTAAHRGIAYMVLVDEDVTDLGGAWAQWQFQIAPTNPAFRFVAEQGEVALDVGDPTTWYSGYWGVNPFWITGTSPAWPGGEHISGILRTRTYDQVYVATRELYGWTGSWTLVRRETIIGYYGPLQNWTPDQWFEIRDSSGALVWASYNSFLMNSGEVAITIDGNAGYYMQWDNLGQTDLLQGGETYALYYTEGTQGGPSTLRSVVTEVCRRSNIPPTDIDVSLLPDPEIGIVVTNQYPAAEVLRSLGQIYLFDVASYDGRIHFIPRGRPSVATITEDDMVDDDQQIEQTTNFDQLIIPRVLHINYYDSENGGLNAGKQTSERAGDRRSVGERSLQTSVLLTADLAAQTASIQHKLMIEEAKGELKFCLPDSFIGLVPSDPIVVQWDSRTERVRIIQVELHDGYQALTCVRDRQSAYTSTVEGLPLPSPTPPPSNVSGETLIEVLDIHLLRDADDGLGLLYYVAIAGQTAAWSGALVELSYDAGANYVDSIPLSVSAIIGELLDTLEDHDAEIPDETSACTVALYTHGAVLSETTLAGMLNRQNLALIGDEIVNFANAEESSAGWTLSYFLRGRKGTNPTAHSAGTRFVLLDRSVLGVIPASLTDLGRTMTFRATSFGAPTDTGTVTSMVYAGQSQVERAASYLSVYRNVDDLHCSWVGVGRLGGGAAVAQGARFTGFRVTFDDGIVAPIVVTTALETLVQDVSTLSSPVTVTVEQMNALTGAGPSIEVIIV